MNDKAASPVPCGLNRWGPEWTVIDECAYCGTRAATKAEPFGDKPACRECWEQICYGE